MSLIIGFGIGENGRDLGLQLLHIGKHTVTQSVMCHTHNRHPLQMEI